MKTVTTMELQIAKSLIQEAEKAYLQRELDKALEFTKKAADYSTDLQFQQGILQTTFLKGEILNTKAIYSCETADFQKAMDYCQQLDLNQPMTHILFGQLYLHQETFDKAEEHFNQALTLADKVENEVDILILGNTYLGFVYFEQHDVDKAIEYAEIAENIIENNTGEFRFFNKNKYYQLSLHIHALTKAYEPLRITAKRLLYNSKLINDKENHAFSLSFLGIVYGVNGIFKIALEHFMLSKQISETIIFRQLTVSIYNNIIIVFRSSRNFENAIKNAQIVLRKFKTIIKEKQFYSIYFNIGVCYIQLNDSVNGKLFYEKALKVARDNRMYSYQVNTLYAIIQYYIEYNYREELISYCDEFEEALKYVSDKFKYAHYSMNGEIQFYRKNYDKAEKLLLQSLEETNTNFTKSLVVLLKSNHYLLYCIHEKRQTVITSDTDERKSTGYIVETIKRA